MSKLKKVGMKILELVKWIYDFASFYNGQWVPTEKVREWLDQDLKLEDLCERTFLSFPALDTVVVSENKLPIGDMGFMRVPCKHADGRYFVAKNEIWDHAVKRFGLAVIRRLEIKTDPNDRVRVKGKIGIARCADSLYGRKPDSRTLNKWLDSGILNATEQDGFWTFSRMKLEEQIKSMPKKAKKKKAEI